MTVAIILAIIAVIFIGLGFVIKWLFIIAAIAALIALISYFTGRTRGRTGG